MSHFKLVSSMGIHFPEDATLTVAISEAQKLSRMTEGEVTVYMEGKIMSHKMAVVLKGEVRFV